MTVPEGFRVEVVASEPDLVQPIAFCFDPKGRIWVVEGKTYPKRAPEGEGKDRILILEDRDKDGSFESRKVFLEGLNLVSGIELGFGGVYIGAAPYFLFIPDRNGDDVPDGKPEVLLDGFGYHDTHETLNSFTWGPDGWLHGCHGIFTHSKVGKPGTPEKDRTPLNAGYWRYHPVRHQFEVFAHGTSNPWGFDFNELGEAFSTACVIDHFWHIVPGARYVRQSNPLGHFNPHIYTNIATIADHKHYTGDLREHAHWGHENQINQAVSDAGGGHAHCGLSIYLGDNFPDKYRGVPFFFNIHGHRINTEILKPKGSGYVASHGPDFLKTHDNEFIGVTIKYGPDGALYFTDWHDKTLCHRTNPLQWNRSDGRMYRVFYEKLTPFKDDLEAMDDLELVGLNFHKNDWIARTARRILQHRVAQKKSNPKRILQPAKHIYSSSNSLATRLRAIWLTHAIGAKVLDLLEDFLANEWAWAVRLEKEDRARNHLNIRAVLGTLTKDDSPSYSPIMRREFASVLQRLPLAERWSIAETLLERIEDESDHNIPQLIWYGVEPLVAADPKRAVELAAKSKIKLVRDHILRRAASNHASLNAAFGVIRENALNIVFARAALQQITLALKGQRNVIAPKNWETLASRLESSPHTDIKDLITQLAVIFGDKRAFPMLRKSLADKTLPSERRIEALVILDQARDEELPPILHSLLGEPDLRLASIMSLGKSSHADTPGRILAMYGSLPSKEKKLALNTLASRAEYARELLASVEKGEIPRADIPSYLARQIVNLGDKKVTDKLGKVWGAISNTPADIENSLNEWKAHLTLPESQKGANPSAGRKVFAATCAACHRLHGQGSLELGPDLTGSNRADLDYILENILDPNALIGKDYQLHIVKLKDGRVLSGMIREETNKTIAVRLAAEKETVLKSDIESRQLAPVSMMPAGLLSALKKEQVRDLIAYLASPTQIPLAGDAPPIDPKSGRIPGAIEGEAMKVLKKSGQVRPQDMREFPLMKWSGNSHLWWTDGKPGDVLKLEFHVPEDGVYNVNASFTKALDYGIMELSLDGKPAMQPVDFFHADGVIHSGPLRLGPHKMSKGTHRFGVKIIGANTRAVKGFMFGLDYLFLKKIE